MAFGFMSGASPLQLEWVAPLPHIMPDTGHLKMY
jgi:hypothetical protein